METSYLRLLLAGGLVAGCLGGPRSVEEPRVTIRKAELVGGSRAGATIRLVASAYNPNPFPVMLRGAQVELDVDGLRMGESVEPITRTLPPRRAVALEIVQPIALRGPGTTRTQSALSRGRSRYRVRGHLDMGTRDRAFDVPFRHEGVLRHNSVALAD